MVSVLMGDPQKGQVVYLKAEMKTLCDSLNEGLDMKCAMWCFGGGKMVGGGRRGWGGGGGEGWGGELE